MKSNRKLFVAISIVCGILASSSAKAENWNEFRGPRGDGHVTGKATPTHWSESKNVHWRIETPGVGWSTPVIWDDQIWMTSATDDGKKLFAVCVDKKNGKLLRNIKVFDIEKPETKNKLNSYASPSPVIEQDRVYVHFGTYGTACLDSAKGKILWSRRDLKLDHQEGPGSSPIVFDDLLLFHCDGRDAQFVVGLDKKTGKTRWRTKRSIDLSKVNDFRRKAFTTPLIVVRDDAAVMLSSAAQGCYAYDPRSGRELWKVRYSGFSAVPRPVVREGVAYVVNDFARPELVAIRLGGEADVTESHVVWRHKGGVPSTPSTIVVDNLIYMVSDKGGVATCLDATTQKVHWKKRLGGNFCASPLYSKGRVYFFNREGESTVVRHGEQYERLAVNRLDEGMMASAAASEGAIYLRTRSRLYKIAED